MQEITSLFIYDESSPSCLRWTVNVMGGRKYKTVRKYVGDCAGTLGKDGYWRVMVSNKKHLVHRIVLAMHGESVDGFIGEHEDGNQSNNKISNLRVTTIKFNTKNLKMSSANASGVAGVSWSRSRGTHYAVAFWNDINGKRISKNFSAKMHGEDFAFKLACACRASAIIELNKLGAGYTDRHGK